MINAEAAGTTRAEVAEKDRARLNAIAGKWTGFLESAYEVCFAHELRKRGLRVETQFPLPVSSMELRVDLGYRPDLLVENEVVVELKAIETVLPVHKPSFFRT